MKNIIVRGAREHNLKNINVEIPHNKFVVITGVSGSGKSSLAFDTIYAEGQRRYVESLSTYARQFLGQMEKPDVDQIEGLSPAVAIDQKSTSRNPRSTVATVTEVYDYLRLLYARVGLQHCPEHGAAVTGQTVQEMVDKLLKEEDGAKVQILAPIARGRKGEFHKELERLERQGFVRVRIDGEILRLDEEIKLKKNIKHTIDVVIDRIIIKKDAKKRITDSMETALATGEGLASVVVENGREIPFSEKAVCPVCQKSFESLEPKSFSFNSPFGACRSCDGLGVTMEIDEERVIPDPSKSILRGAIKPWASDPIGSWYGKMLEAALDHYGYKVTTTWEKLPKKARQIVLYGSDEEIDFQYEGESSLYEFTRTYEGVIPNLQRRYKETKSEGVREWIETYMTRSPCPDCKGARLNPDVLAVVVGGINIYDFTRLPVGEAISFVKNLKLERKEKIIAKDALKEIEERLRFLADVGLGYLTLDRAAATLSGGEAQRIRLATQIGSRLQGVLYVLDEPSIGLHHRDNERLLATLMELRDVGNTVLVVEHDSDTILKSDHVVDLGPGAGRHGGKIIAEGTPKQIVANPKSITGQYLSGKKEIAVPEERRVSQGKSLIIRGASENNLKAVDAEIPLGLFVAVTGVSGSGKSSLILDTLYASLARHLHGSNVVVGKHKRIDGLHYIDKVIQIDQTPIGRTPRSNPATYCGAFTPIRDLFAALPESKARGYKAGRFSFNVKGGRCEACEGAGLMKIEMHFLPDVYVHCDVCKGKRYNRETLEITYKGKSIADVLEMTVEEGLDFFKNHPKIHKKFEMMHDVGLGYIHLGQSATTLSGGEAQRLKLTTELAKTATGRTLYILDEPTTGLHFADVHCLLDVLNRLVERGNTVVVIEHNLDVVKCADHIIDLGPEGGDGGGRVIATGTPEEVAKNRGSFTGQALCGVL